MRFIDLWTAMDDFVKDMQTEIGSNAKCQIPLKVEYEHLGDYPSRKANRAAT